MRARRTLLTAALLALSSVPAAADPSTEDRLSAQAAISGQIDALSRDDGAGAYAYAADAIKTLFPSPERFIEMVKRGYAPVYRPRTKVFGPTADIEGGISQELLITDADGVDWIASYTLARDAEGRWRITGCRLEKNDRDAA